MPLYSKQEQIIQLKAVKRTWATEYTKQVELGVKGPIKRFYDYYKEQSDKATAVFLQKGSLDAGDMVTLFTNNDYIKLYESLYESIGLRFAKWYAGNFDKFISKANNPSNNVDTWRTQFKSKGAQVAGERIALVKGSAKTNLMNVIRRLMMDEVFMAAGYEERARMLRGKFGQYNKYQAERLVRTEANFIANYATHESAKTIFPGADMQKEWITVGAGDYPRHLPKHKADHRVMDGQVVDFDKPFQVPTINGVENLMVPGDPNGSSFNVINCKCTSAPFPKPGAQAVTQISDLNFGLAGQMAEQSLYDLAESVQTVAAATVEAANIVAQKPVEEAVVADDFVEAKTIKEGKLKAQELLGKQGIELHSIRASKELTVEYMNRCNRQLQKLSNEYIIDTKYNQVNKVKLSFASSGSTLGSVGRYPSSGNLGTINYGHRIPDYKHHKRYLDSTQFHSRMYSVADEANLDLTTVTHETFHVITDSGAIAKENPHVKKFFDELYQIQRSYNDELRELHKANNFKQLNEIYIGKYGNTDLDEFGAECFSEYKLCSTPSKYAKLVGELIDEYFKK